MKVLIDGVAVEVKNDIRIIYDLDQENKPIQLQVTANHEGLLYDVFNDSGEEPIATSYEFACDIVDSLTE